MNEAFSYLPRFPLWSLLRYLAVQPELRLEVWVAAGTWVMVGVHLGAGWVLRTVPCSTM